MLPMAIQPNLNLSGKPIAFPCQNFFEKASIFSRPQSLSLSRFKPLNRQSHRHSTRILKLSATAAAEAAPVTENTLADDDVASEPPPDKEVPPLSLSLSLSLPLLICVCVVFFFFFVLCLVCEKMEENEIGKYVFFFFFFLVEKGIFIFFFFFIM
jgi:hypothetical protein